MNKRLQHTTFILTVLLVLALSAIATVPVLADSGTTPTTTGPASGGRTTNKGSSSNSLSQVPSGTKVVIVDSNGDKLPLGSQAAQDILNSGDPVWCPSSIAAPTPNVGGCTQTADNLYDLIQNVSNQAANFKPTVAASTIWILSSAPSQSVYDNSGSEIYIDGSSLDSGNVSAWANFALTLKGGWKGSGLSTIDQSNPSHFTVPIDIENWNNNVTVSDIAISGTSSDGLAVHTTGNITVTRVDSNSNASDGLFLDNRNGKGTVTVSYGQFNSNNYAGMIVHSNGAIVISTVTANGNATAWGAYLDNCNQSSTSPYPCTTTATVTISGTNTFNNNYFNGLAVYSNGNISAGGLHADGNSAGYDGASGGYYNISNYWYSGGVQLENDFGGSAGTITITGANTFTNNYEDGLDVYSNGTITTNNLTATDNGVKGAPPTGWEWVGAALSNGPSTAITVNGTNTFNNNYDDGLDITSGGAIKVNNVTADLNTNGDGLFVDNCVYYDDGSIAGCLAAPQTVTLTGINTFNGNGWDGLRIFSYGNILTNDLNASGDGHLGAYIENDNVSYWTGLDSKGTVTLSGTNIFAQNSSEGLSIQSFGAIKASNLHAINNFGNGAYLDNSYAPTAAAVTLTNYNAFNSNVESGLVVNTHGTITLSTISANYNGYDGAILDDGINNGGVISNVTLTGNDSFEDNNYSGLFVIATGTITVNTLSLSADGNKNGVGVYLRNSNNGYGTPKSVVLKGTNTFNDNYGQYYDDSSVALAGAGLVVVSNGSITVNNVTANGTINGAGVLLNNCVLVSGRCTGSGSVVLSGFGSFNDNAGDGIDVLSKNTVTMPQVIADGNQGVTGSDYAGDGLYVNTAGIFKLTCGQFVNNADYGIDLDTVGTATITGAVLIDNGTGDTVNQAGGGAVSHVGTCTLP